MLRGLIVKKQGSRTPWSDYRHTSQDRPDISQPHLQRPRWSQTATRRCRVEAEGICIGKIVRVSMKIQWAGRSRRASQNQMTGSLQYKMLDYSDGFWIAHRRKTKKQCLRLGHYLDLSLNRCCCISSELGTHICRKQCRQSCQKSLCTVWDEDKSESLNLNEIVGRLETKDWYIDNAPSR